jgi:hypothetical protein
MGLFAASEWPDSDLALVDINAPFTTTSQVNGYSGGIINIPAEYAGYRQPLVGTSVCRSGQTTGGLFCGTVSKVNDMQEFGVLNSPSVTLTGIVKTTVCQLGGDSGGPFILASSDLAQGTLIGGRQTPCPGVGDETWFEPIEKHMTELIVADEFRTQHGSNAPDIVNPVCPDTSLVAAGIYVCETEYYSQGLTTVDWSSNVPGQSGTGPFFFGSCTPGAWTTVDLDIDNAHGTDSQSFGFTCPSFP